MSEPGRTVVVVIRDGDKDRNGLGWRCVTEMFAPMDVLLRGGGVDKDRLVDDDVTRDGRV